MSPSRRSHNSPDAQPAAWTPPRVGVCPAQSAEHLLAGAHELAAALQISVVPAETVDHDLLLVVADDGLELREAGPGPSCALRIDFSEHSATARRLATASRRQPLARAVGFRKRTPTVIDATAGLGRDALWLVRLGCQVTAIERSPILGALLRDALPRLTPPPTGLTLVVADAVDVLSNLAPDHAPDVVYLDPMFPPRGKSALPKKDMRILRRLVGDDPDAAALLEVARQVARDRVVVKRTPHAPPLAPGSTVSYHGKLARYDAYLTRV